MGPAVDSTSMFNETNGTNREEENESNRTTNETNGTNYTEATEPTVTVFNGTGRERAWTFVCPPRPDKMPDAADIGVTGPALWGTGLDPGSASLEDRSAAAAEWRTYLAPERARFSKLGASGPPTASSRRLAASLSVGLGCRVCHQLLNSLWMEVERASYTNMRSWIARGCPALVKHHLIRHGWIVISDTDRCGGAGVVAADGQRWCFLQDPQVEAVREPDRAEVYDPSADSLMRACEETLALHDHEVATFMDIFRNETLGLPSDGSRPKVQRRNEHLTGSACRQAACCEAMSGAALSEYMDSVFVPEFSNDPAQGHKRRWDPAACIRGDPEVSCPADNDWQLQFSEDLQADKEGVLAAVRKDGMMLRYANSGLQDDREVALAAVKQNGRALRYASKRRRADMEIVDAAFANTEEAFAYAEKDAREKLRSRIFMASSPPTDFAPPSPPPSLPPSPVPSLPPSPPSCVPCDDRPSQYMISHGLKCSTWLWAHHNMCISDAIWRQDRYCAWSCFTNGNGYEGDPCCPDGPHV
eukprot:TRINITY_DN16606_c0_g2_i1.p1 TRINITY_DN16606_c0_g2~~TRINITY_DN16606_c0_g2_i1.p1  ORF type:complete len:578 (-),score=78.76 TRINITY_DN16606_c0_g2_i1:9-1598(-)